MADLINPHDRFFKEALSQHDTAVDFLRYYLPADVAALLDLSTIELIKDSFVDETLRLMVNERTEFTNQSYAEHPMGEATLWLN